jgi:hypothetical protein
VFLPLFFTLLAIAFGVAAWMRLSAYSATAGTQLAPTPVAAEAPQEAPTPVANDTSDYQLVPYDSSASQSSGSQAANRQASSRAQRYNELLRAGPPPAPVEPPKEPSLLDRMVAPIANALGMSKPKPPAPVRAAQAPSTPREPTPQRNDPSARSGSNEQTQQRQEDDPETDLIAPQLLTAEFAPPEIRDGETTTFAILVRDNLSGVRSVSGVITSPGGSLQGFAATREGESDRFLARVTVPADAADGLWVVKYMTLTDNASNTVNLNQGALPPTSSFKVTSAGSDASGPQLKAVWVDRPMMRAGEKNTVFVQAEDEKSGVSLVSGVLVSPSKFARLGFGCRSTSNGTWECPLTPPSCLDCGGWKLEQIQLQDKANNLATFRMDNQIVSQVAVDITADRCDAAPPVVTSLSFDQTVISNAKATVLTVHATMVDEGGCGVASISGQAVPPGGVGGQRRYISFGPSADGQTFVGKLEIPQFAAKGQWTVAWIQALDKGHNLRAYSVADPVVSRATFRVE